MSSSEKPAENKREGSQQIWLHRRNQAKKGLGDIFIIPIPAIFSRKLLRRNGRNTILGLSFTETETSYHEYCQDHLLLQTYGVRRRVHPDIVYAHRESGDLTMQIVSPIAPDLPRKEENLTFNKMMPAAEVFQCPVAGSLYTRFVTVPENYQNLAISFTP